MGITGEFGERSDIVNIILMYDILKKNILGNVERGHLFVS